MHRPAIVAILISVFMIVVTATRMHIKNFGITLTSLLWLKPLNMALSVGHIGRLHYSIHVHRLIDRDTYKRQDYLSQHNCRTDVNRRRYCTAATDGLAVTVIEPNANRFSINTGGLCL